MTMKEGYKFMMISMVIGISAMIVGLLTGDIACDLLGWFDNYDVSQEAIL